MCNFCATSNTKTDLQSVSLGGLFESDITSLAQDYRLRHLFIHCLTKVCVLTVRGALSRLSEGCHLLLPQMHGSIFVPPSPPVLQQLQILGPAPAVPHLSVTVNIPVVAIPFSLTLPVPPRQLLLLHVDSAEPQGQIAAAHLQRSGQQAGVWRRQRDGAAPARAQVWERDAAEVPARSCALGLSRRRLHILLHPPRPVRGIGQRRLCR